MPGLGTDPPRLGHAPRLGELLLEMGFIDRTQLETALEQQRHTGQRLGAVFVERGVVTESRLVRALARQLNLQTCDPVSSPVSEKVLAMLPRELAVALRVVPIAMRRTPSGPVFCVATADPMAPHVAEDLEHQVGMQIEMLLCGETEVELALARHYGRSAPPVFTRGSPAVSVTGLSVVPGQPEEPIELEELVPEGEERAALVDAFHQTGALDHLLPRASRTVASPFPDDDGFPRLEATGIGAMDALAGRAPTVADILPSGFLDPVQPEFGASAPPPKFDLPDLARASVELPDAEEEMVNSTDLSGLEEPPLAIPSNWASESFSELKVTDAVPPPGAQPNWGDLVPTSRSSSPPGLPPQTAKTTQELGIAPPSAFAKEERSLGFEIDVAEPEEHYETTLVQEEVDLDDAPSQVTQRLPSSRPPPPPGSIPIIRSTQPTGVADVARARALLGRLVEGSELSAAETQWVLRLLAFGLIETWGEQQMRDAVMRLGPPP